MFLPNCAGTSALMDSALMESARSRPEQGGESTYMDPDLAPASRCAFMSTLSPPM